jgi:hypothetical protein
MTPEKFIDALRKVVRDAAIEGSLSAVAYPPGRNPPQELRDASEWFRSLDRDQQQLLTSIVSGAVDSAIFGFLCVLDGVRQVEDGRTKGRFELRYIGDDTILLLNAPDDDMLHDLYNTPGST